MSWSDEDWARYASPIKVRTSKHGGASHSSDSVKTTTKSKSKPNKGRSSKRSSASSSNSVSGMGEAPASVAPSATVSTAPSGAGKRPMVSETTAFSVPSAGLPLGIAMGIHGSCAEAVGSVAVTMAVGPVSAGPSSPFMAPPMAQPDASMASWLGPSDSGTGGLPSLHTLSDLTVTSQSAVISTRGSMGTLVTSTAPVTSVASMGSRPIASVGAVDLGSHQGLPYMYQLMQHMLQGLQGQPLAVRPPRGLPTVASTAVANMVTDRGNYLVQITGGSIPSTGLSGYGNSTNAGHPGAPRDSHLVNPLAVPRHPDLERLAAGPQATRWVHQLKPGQSSSQSAPGGGTSTSESHPLLMDSSESSPESLGKGPMEDMVSGYIPDGQGVRAANIGRIPANKAAQQTAILSFQANLATAMKYLPKEVLPPIATPAPQKSFTVSANTKPETVEFLQFPPSEGFAQAFQVAQSQLYSKDLGLLRGGGPFNFQVCTVHC